MSPLGDETLYYDSPKKVRAITTPLLGGGVDVSDAAANKLYPLATSHPAIAACYH